MRTIVETKQKQKQTSGQKENEKLEAAFKTREVSERRKTSHIPQGKKPRCPKLRTKQ